MTRRFTLYGGNRRIELAKKAPMSSATRVMKRFTAGTVPDRVAFNYDDMQQRLDDYKARILAECQEQVLQATEEAERLRQEARQQGFDEGRAEGYRNGLRAAEAEIDAKIAEEVTQQTEQRVHEQLDTVLPALQNMLSEFHTTSSQHGADWEREIVTLSLAIAEKVLRHELSLGPDRLASIIQQGLELAVGKTSVALHLHPEDLQRIEPELMTLVPDANRFSEIKLVPSAHVSSGGCVVVTEHGRIDAQIETMLQRIGSELMEGS